MIKKIDEHDIDTWMFDDKRHESSQVKYREGDERKNWMRSDRFYYADNSWWFETRENKKSGIGPFTTKAEAERELCHYLRNA